MASTLTNIVIPRDQWIDLYQESNISVGSKISLQNIGGHQLLLYAGASQPTTKDAYRICRPYETFTNEAGDPGAWALSEGTGTKINVAEAI